MDTIWKIIFIFFPLTLKTWTIMAGLPQNLSQKYPFVLDMTI